jgi:signal peptidase I
MSNPASNSTVVPTGNVVTSQPEFVGTKRHLLAALLSAFIPGAGQLLLAQRRRGILLLLACVVVAFGVWPLRLPRFFDGFVPIVLGWLGLSSYGASALLEHRNQIDGRTSKWWVLAVPLLTFLAFNAVFAPLFLVAGFRVLKFNSSAMETTLLKGDQFIVDKMFYRDHSVVRNDLVLLRIGDYPQTVKRVIAIGGDTVEGANRRIIVNGHFVAEPFIRHLAYSAQPWMDNFGPVTVPVSKYFVMGDNRDVSLDSRSPEYGLLDAQAITGKPLYIFASPIKARIGKKLE